MGQRLIKISIPAAMARMANPVVIVVDSLTLSNGKRPVRINQTANKTIPKLLPARPSATLIFFSFEELRATGKELCPDALQSWRRTEKQSRR
jgi:hypothetical protein